MSGARLAIEGLSKRWPDGTHALADVHVAVPAGTALAVLGPSGAGKSTLLRCIAGLERPDAGTIRLGERVLVGAETFVPPEDRGVGMVFQALELWPHMTVAEHLAFGLPGRPRGWRAKRNATVRELAEAVGLPSRLLGRRPGTLSGGEQQRVAIARTLAPEPDVILYDEPLANLDPDRRTSIRALIRRLAREHGSTLVYVTHDAEEALELGDAVAVFGDGRLIEEGEPMALYRRPNSLAAARALGPISAVPGTVTDGRARTPLGEHPTPLADGPCLALWRPEGLQASPEGTVSARVEDVIARGTHYAFMARVGGIAVRGSSVDPLSVGAEVTLRVEAPATVLAGGLPEEVA